jgi:ketosteroid isomerase-like protein
MSNPVKTFFSLIGSGDAKAALELVGEDAVFEAQGPSSVPIYGVFEGRERVEHFLTVLSELFDTEAFEFKKWAEVDNYVFSHGYMRHRVKKTGRVFQCEWALVCQVQNGLITSYKMFEDTAALQTAHA